MGSKSNSEILEDWKAYDETYTRPLPDELENTEEDDNKNWAISRFGGVVLERVGNGVQTAEYCGSYRATYGCLHVEKHDKSTLDLVNHKGKVPLKKIFQSCDKPSCPVCFKRGWANLEARKGFKRIEAISRGYVDSDGKKHMGLGQAEHIISSVPRSDYVLPFDKLKAKNQAVLESRGVLGGFSIFHLQRYRDFKKAAEQGKPQGWYISPHWHTVGWVNGGYGKCRGCPNAWKDPVDGGMHVKKTEKCLVCNGFEGVTRRRFLKEGGVFKESNGLGWIVKVKGERKSIQATLFYQLSHATFVRGSERAHVGTWWGVAGYTRAKLVKEDRKLDFPCPICGSPMVEVVRVGGVEEEWWVKEWEEPFLDKDGKPTWAVVQKEEKRKWSC